MPLAFMPMRIQRRAANTVFPFWGGQPWRGSVTPEWDPQTARVGSIILALAAAALLVAWRRRETWVFFALAFGCLCAGFEAPPVSNLLHPLPLFDMALDGRRAF